MVEVKVSRSDFLADKRKKFRGNPKPGVGDWRFYLSPEGVVNEEDLPEGWGLLHYKNGKVFKVCGVPHRAKWGKSYPFLSNKEVEVSMLTSALRRVKLRGNFGDVYDSVLNI